MSLGEPTIHSWLHWNNLGTSISHITTAHPSATSLQLVTPNSPSRPPPPHTPIGRHFYVSLLSSAVHIQTSIINHPGYIRVAYTSPLHKSHGKPPCIAPASRPATTCRTAWEESTIRYTSQIILSYGRQSKELKRAPTKSLYRTKVVKLCLQKYGKIAYSCILQKKIPLHSQHSTEKTWTS
jgi:hypothetical protein